MNVAAEGGKDDSDFEDRKIYGDENMNTEDMPEENKTQPEEEKKEKIIALDFSSHFMSRPVDEIVEILQSDNLSCENEDQVISFLFLYFKEHEFDQKVIKQEYVDQLFQAIRYDRVSTEEILQKATFSNFRNNKHFMLAYHRRLAKGSEEKIRQYGLEVITKPRNYTEPPKINFKIEVKKKSK